MPTSNPSHRTRFSPALGTFLLLIGLNLLNYIDRYILPGAQPLIQREFHATDQQMGALTTAMFFVYMLAAPLTGWLGDRYSRKPLIITGAILWSLATLGTVWVHSYWTFYLRQGFVGDRRGDVQYFCAGGACRFLSGTRSQPGSVDLLSGDSGRRSAGISCRRGVGFALGVADAVLCVRDSGAGDCGAVCGVRARAGAGSFSDHLRATAGRATVLGIFRNPAFLTATLGLATLTFAMGGISAWMPTFLHRIVGLSVANSSLTVGAITVVDGIAGTLMGGWLAQVWLRTNYRALYLLSFWSVALTLPCGAMIFFGPRAWAIPSLFAAEFFLFLNTGPLNAAIVNSVSAPVRATAISINLFCIHFFGDTFSPQIIGAISDHSNLSIGLGATLVFLW